MRSILVHLKGVILVAVGYGRSNGVTIFPMTEAARGFVLSGIKKQPADAVPRFTREDVGRVAITRFPQTEPLVVLDGNLNGYDVIFFFSYEGRIAERNEELGLALQIARAGGADRMTVVFGYVPNSRGDKRDQRHSSVALKHFLDTTVNQYDACVIAFDLHNATTIEFVDGPHRMLSLRKVMMAEAVREHDVTVTVSADAGGVKRMRKWSETLYLDDGRCLAKVVVDKMRAGNDSFAMAEECYGADVKGQDVLIVDDEAMTLGTLVSAAKVLTAAGALSVRAVAYHGILVGPAIERLVQSPISELIVTNTVPVPHSKIKRAGGKLRVVDVSGYLVEAARKWYALESLSPMIDYAYEKK